MYEVLSNYYERQKVRRLPWNANPFQGVMQSLQPRSKISRYVGIIFEEKAAMIREQCRVPMIERLPTRQMEEADEGKAIVFECPQCGHTEYQLRMASFWRRLLAA